MSNKLYKFEPTNVESWLRHKGVKQEIIDEHLLGIIDSYCQTNDAHGFQSEEAIADFIINAQELKGTLEPKSMRGGKRKSSKKARKSRKH